MIGRDGFEFVLILFLLGILIAALMERDGRITELEAKVAGLELRLAQPQCDGR